MSKSFSIIISNNLRSLEYLNVFKKLNLIPKIIYVNDNRNSFIKNKITIILNNNQIFKNKKIFLLKNLVKKSSNIY